MRAGGTVIDRWGAAPRVLADAFGTDDPHAVASVVSEFCRRHLVVAGAGMAAPRPLLPPTAIANEAGEHRGRPLGLARPEPALRRRPAQRDQRLGLARGPS